MCLTFFRPLTRLNYLLSIGLAWKGEWASHAINTHPPEGTGAAASVEGVTWRTNLSRAGQGDCQSKLLLQVQAALDKPLPMCSWQWRGTVCSSVSLQFTWSRITLVSRAAGACPSILKSSYSGDGDSTIFLLGFSPSSLQCLGYLGPNPAKA